MNATSEFCYVWAWLPGERHPTAIGSVGLDRTKRALEFAYARTYRADPNAVSIAPSLPLRDGTFTADDAHLMPGPLRDAMPDAWGRRVLAQSNPLLPAADGEPAARGELAYMLASGTNRFGAIDFQQSHTTWTARETPASIDQLHEAADLLESGQLMPYELDAALIHGTSIGGARPKALVKEDNREYIAKFSSSSDTIPVIQGEAAALSLARTLGISVPQSKIVESLGKLVLLVERFDRTPSNGRRFTVSALTLSGYDELRARYATYLDLLDALTKYSPLSVVGPELFERIAFNMAISNSDDHARNHAAFWDGHKLELTPAFDLAPNARSGETASQAMAYGITPDGTHVRESNFARLVEFAPRYGLTYQEGRTRLQNLIEGIHRNWSEAADSAQLSHAQREALWGRQILNPGTLHNL